MRLISWNCNLSLCRKIDRLIELDPDVAVLQECEQSFYAPDGYTYTWCGNNPRKGLGILCKGHEVIVSSFARSEWTYFLPVDIPAYRLRLLAIWAYNHRAARFGASSVGYPHLVLDLLSPWLAEGRSLVVGDFNNSVVWDKPGKATNLSNIRSSLEAIALTSAYHSFHVEEFGGESSNTHYHTKNIDKPYHIDYCFVHKSLAVSAVSVPPFADWRIASDHVPIIVDLDGCSVDS